MFFSKKNLKDIELKKVYFISSKLDLFLELVEPKNPYSQEEKRPRIWLKINSTHFYTSKNSTYDIPVYRIQEKDNSTGYRVDTKSLTQAHIEYLYKNQKFFSYSDAISEENIGNYFPIYGEPLERGELLQLQDFSKLKLDIKPVSSEKRNKIISSFIDNLAITPNQAKGLLLSLGIRDLLNGNMPKKNGALLFGPPGTGKTRSMDVYFKLFKEDLGFNLVKIDASQLINNAVVGGFASKISEKIFQPAIEKILSTKKPCLIYVDEATALVSKPKESNVSDWYQEGLDTIKRFLNTKSFPGIIMCVATNAELEDLDKTILKRRLGGVYFDFLDENQFRSLWEFKLKENLGLTYSNNEIGKLSKICANAINGSFIDSFTLDYKDYVLTSDLPDSFKSKEDERKFYESALSSSRVEVNFTFERLYGDFLNELNSYLDDEIKAVKEQINKMHYISEVEKENKVSEGVSFLVERKNLVNKELRSLNTQDYLQTEDQQNTSNNQQKSQQNSTISDQQLDLARTHCINLISKFQRSFVRSTFNKKLFMDNFNQLEIPCYTILQRANQTNFSDYAIIVGIFNQLEHYGTDLTFQIPAANVQRMFTILQNLLPRIE